jgi:soluble lytic murein transglycosylase-like protein
MRSRGWILALVIWMVAPIGAEIKAYWYVIHDVKNHTYKDYFGAIDPRTYQGILPPYCFVENIFECAIQWNTSGIPESAVEKLVRRQFRKDTYKTLAKYDPSDNPYVAMAKYDTLIEYCSRFYHLNHNYIKAMVLKESGANPRYTGADGRIGLMQIPPALARQIIREKQLAGVSLQDVYTPEWNIGFGCWHLQRLSEEFDGNADNIIAAWHTGLNEVKSNMGKPFSAEVQQYVDRVKYLANIFDCLPQPEDRTRTVIK